MEITYNTGDGAPAPYTPGVIVSQPSRWLFVSGQGPMDPQTNQKYLGNDIGKQITITLDNLKRVVEGSGFAMENVVKVTVFLTNMDDSATLNKIYQEYFPKNPPARSTVTVAALPNGQAVEIEAIVVA